MQEEATQLLCYVQNLSQRLNDPQLLKVFKDAVISLKQDDTRNQALINLYNSFKNVDQNVLKKLNTFLPYPVRYVINDNNEIVLPEQLLRYRQQQSSSQVRQTQNGTYDIFLQALNSLTQPMKSQRFKDLISKFVKNQPNQRLEVLQFLVEACLLLHDQPELLAGLIGFLNVGWQQYAQKNLGVVSINQFAVIYGIVQQPAQLQGNDQQIANNQQQGELFAKIIEVITKNQLTVDQQNKRKEIIQQILGNTQKMSGICHKLMQQMNVNTVSQQPEKINTRQSQQQKGQVPVQNPLAQILECPIDFSIDQMVILQNQFYEKALDPQQFLLDLKVPVSTKMVDRLFEISRDTPYVFQQIVQIYQSKTVVDDILQKIAMDDLQKQLGSEILPITFDDCIQADRALRFKNKCEMIDKLAINVTQQEKQQLYNQIYNELVRNTYNQQLENDIYKIDNLVDTITFFNTNALTQFQTKQAGFGNNEYTYIPIDSEPLKLVTKAGEKPGMKVINQCQTDQSFKKINNMTLQEQHKYYRKLLKLDQIKQTQDSYKSINQLRKQIPLTHSLINYRVVAAFQQGHDNTSSKGLNPYQIGDLTQQDILKTIEEVDDPNMLEEYLHRYDVFISNLKQIETQMALLSKYEETGVLRPELPLSCYQLLSSVIGEQYLQLFYQEPTIASKYILPIITSLLDNLISYKTNVFNPVYEIKLKQLYFKNHDWTQQSWQENDKKLLSVKQLQVELYQHKKAAGALQKQNLLQLLQKDKTVKDSQFKKYQLPWDNEFVDNDLLTYDDIIKTIQNSKAAGCTVLFHTSSNNQELTDQELDQFDNNKEIIMQTAANYIQYCKQFKNKIQQQSKHYCSDIHHIMVKFTEFDQEIIDALLKQIVDHNQNEEEQKTFFKLIIRLINLPFSLIDNKLYQFLRLMLIIIERLTQLKKQVNSKPIQMKNYLQEQMQIINDNSLILQPKSSFQQHLQSQQIYSGLQQLYQHREPKIQAYTSNFNLLLQILTSNRKTMSVDIYDLFGLDCYKAQTMSSLLIRLRTLFKELYNSYLDFNQIIEKKYENNKKFDTGSFTSFLIDLQTTKGVILLLQVQGQLKFDTALEGVFKQMLNLASTDLMVMEKVQDVICWSVLDF